MISRIAKVASDQPDDDEGDRAGTLLDGLREDRPEPAARSRWRRRRARSRGCARRARHAGCRRRPGRRSRRATPRARGACAALVRAAAAASAAAFFAASSATRASACACLPTGLRGGGRGTGLEARGLLRGGSRSDRLAGCGLRRGGLLGVGGVVRRAGHGSHPSGTRAGLACTSRAADYFCCSRRILSASRDPIPQAGHAAALRDARTFEQRDDFGALRVQHGIEGGQPHRTGTDRDHERGDAEQGRTAESDDEQGVAGRDARPRRRGPRGRPRRAPRSTRSRVDACDRRSRDTVGAGEPLLEVGELLRVEGERRAVAQIPADPRVGRALAPHDATPRR